jgi:hypothetical protein
MARQLDATLPAEDVDAPSALGRLVTVMLIRDVHETARLGALSVDAVRGYGDRLIAQAAERILCSRNVIPFAAEVAADPAMTVSVSPLTTQVGGLVYKVGWVEVAPTSFSLTAGVR